jgi:hypothetical protein
MLPPNNMPLGQLAKEEGNSQATLAKWRTEARSKGQFLPDSNVGPEGWTSRDKLSAVIETASMNVAELGEYCRRRGIYFERSIPPGSPVSGCHISLIGLFKANYGQDL